LSESYVDSIVFTGWLSITHRRERRAFPDGQSCLVLAAARLRHVTGAKGSSIRYLDMNLLAECTFQEHGMETDELTA